jgi:N-acetylmuramoyl-L-alanine amidase CwlA
MQVVKNMLPLTKYKLKAPYSMKPEVIVVHNTANDATARNEIAYMIKNDNQVSYHYAIDDREIVQAIPENRNAWHAGDGGSGTGNRKGIGIEICFSKSGGARFIKAEQLAAKFIAYKLKEYGWGIDKVKKHQDYSGKYCPHRTLDMGWDRFLDMIRVELGEVGLNLIINGSPRTVAGSIKSGISYIKIDGKDIPARILGEALGFKVGWDATKKAVIWND